MQKQRTLKKSNNFNTMDLGKTNAEIALPAY
jgi:hypothetical protein